MELVFICIPWSLFNSSPDNIYAMDESPVAVGLALITKISDNSEVVQIAFAPIESVKLTAISTRAMSFNDLSIHISNKFDL